MCCDGIAGIPCTPQAMAKPCSSMGSLLLTEPLSLGLFLCHFSASGKLSHFQNISVGEVFGFWGVFFAFFSPQESYFKALLALCLAPGLLCFVLAHLRCHGCPGVGMEPRCCAGLGRFPRERGQPLEGVCTLGNFLWNVPFPIARAKRSLSRVTRALCDSSVTEKGRAALPQLIPSRKGSALSCAAFRAVEALGE